MLRNKLIAAMALFASFSAHAIPKIENSELLGDLQSSNKTQPFSLVDDSVEGLVYVPYDEVRVTYNGGEPMIGVVFGDDFAKITVGVEGGFSERAIRYIKQLQRKGKTVKPILPQNGSWSVGVKGENGSSYVNGSSSDKLETIIPTNMMAIEIYLEDKQQVKAYTHALRTNGALAIRYDYTFLAREKESHFLLEGNWKSIFNRLKLSVSSADKTCRHTNYSAGSDKVDYTKGCAVNKSVIRVVAEELIADGVVEVTYDGDFEETEKAKYHKLVDGVTTAIIDKMTNQNRNDPFKDKTPGKQDPICEIEVHGCTLLQCEGSDTFVSISTQKEFEDIDFDMDVISKGTKMAKASISSTLPGVCEDYDTRSEVIYIADNGKTINGCEYLESTTSTISEITAYNEKKFNESNASSFPR